MHAIVAVLIFYNVRSISFRSLVLLVLNLLFFLYFMPTWQTMVFVFYFLVGTYFLGEFKVKYEANLPAYFTPVILLLFWIFLFFIKDPSLLVTVNPFHYFPVGLVGASYLFFRALIYLVDVEIFGRRSIVKFTNYMLFFPTLLAGPIDRYDNYDRYSMQPLTLKKSEILSSLHRIANGYIKKYVVAENILKIGIFSEIPDSTELLWIAVLSQLLILYLDFSGYCDIVIGLARLLGFKVYENFNQPFKAQNIQEFWGRWHMSLTHFVTDYIFNPLNRWGFKELPSKTHIYFNLFVYFFCMILIALWHDTTMGFFVFGIVHGCALILVQLRKRYFPEKRYPILKSRPFLVLGRVTTYCFVSISMTLWYYGPGKTFEILIRLIGV